MALKRLPADMTFDAVRNQPSPFAKPTPKDPDTGNKNAETGKDDVASVPAEPQIETPVSDRDREKGGEKGDELRDADKPADEPSVEPEPEPKPTGGGALPPAARKPAKEETVVVKGRISPLADGVTPIYDSVKARYGEKAALKHLINLALESYAAALLSGDESTLEKQPGFASHPPSRVTYPSRVVSRAFHDAARAHIDPLGIMARTGFGTAVIQTALEWYVARNPMKE